MKFHLIDRLVHVVPDKSVEAVKNLSLAEEYLADHFPGNPVMPGVLMLETMIQAAGWLLRVSKDFEFSIHLMVQARNVRYGRFVRPGDQLVLNVDQTKSGDGCAEFRGRGMVDGSAAVSARFTVNYFNLSDRDESLADTDQAIREAFKKRFVEINGPQAMITEPILEQS